MTLLSPSGVIPVGSHSFTARVSTRFNTTLTGTVSYYWLFSEASQPVVTTQPNLAYNLTWPGPWSLLLKANSSFTRTMLNTELDVLG